MNQLYHCSWFSISLITIAVISIDSFTPGFTAIIMMVREIVLAELLDFQLFF